MDRLTKGVVVRVQLSLFDCFKKKCELNYKNVSEVMRDLMFNYVKENLMFESVPVPSREELVVAAEILLKEAKDNGGSIRVVKKSLGSDDQYKLMFESAKLKFLVNHNVGIMPYKTFETFEFQVY